MQRKKQGSIEWLEFDLLSEFKNLKHGVVLRHGGASNAPFSSLNLGFSCGDDPANVLLNWKSIQTLFQLDKIVSPKLEHGGKICHVKTQLTEPCDAVATNLKNLTLMITHADCQVALFYDPVNCAIANAHSGWRGSIHNIYHNTIEFMKKTYGSSPKDLLVCISPSLGSEDAQFINFQTELPKEFWEFQVKPFFFDFWSISRMQLQKSGILPHHIEFAGISTYSNTHDFFSYRREKPTGRNGTFIKLEQSNWAWA